MTRRPPPSGRAAVGRALGPGLVAVTACSCVYGGLALTVDFPRAALGFQSDEATYYMMAHSLADDGDLTYRREDLVRVWQRVPVRAGRRVPETRARHRRRGLMCVPVRLDPHAAGSRPDAPLLRQVVHLSAVRGAVRAGCSAPTDFSCSTRSCSRSSCCAATCSCTRAMPRLPSALLAPALSSWRRSSRCISSGSRRRCSTSRWRSSPTSAGSTRRWRRRERAPRGTRWLFAAGATLAAAVLLGIATFSKPTNALLFLPMVAWLSAGAGDGARAVCSPAWCSRAVAGGLFWHQHGDLRRLELSRAAIAHTFYCEFPFQTDVDASTSALPKARDESLAGRHLQPARRSGRT